jgi:DNA repair exonuclease SbcCD nuclease subunit
MAKENKDSKSAPKEVVDYKAKRRLEAEALEASKKATVNEREEFRKFFAKISPKLKLEKSMEEVLWLHLKASGFAEKERFADGICHFGFKLN